MTILVSACLLGIPCRYDGKSVPCPAALALQERHTLVPICPEQLGGLPTPRVPAERQGARVINRENRDVTDAFYGGAAQALRIAELSHAQLAVLKQNSPSCGCGSIYDGSFCGSLTAGMGVTAELLTDAGIPVMADTDERLRDL